MDSQGCLRLKVWHPEGPPQELLDSISHVGVDRGGRQGSRAENSGKARGNDGRRDERRELHALVPCYAIL